MGRVILLFVAVIMCHSCTSGKGGQGSVAAAYDSLLAKGRVIDSVVCRQDAGHSYALYLPSYYNPRRAFPCIVFFDAHARGALPVSTYRTLAEQYGFVFVGSNMSRNGRGWEETQSIVKLLMVDVRSRINIDAQRIYTSGFSGGSRVAVAIAATDSGVAAGVIGCAAGFPGVDQGLRRKFDYFGVVGSRDFNLPEMEQWDATLGQNGFEHDLLISAGKHGWAIVADFRTALLWMQLRAMKEHKQPKNDTLIATLRKDYTDRIAASAGDEVNAFRLLDAMIQVLDGLDDIATLKKQYEIAAAAEKLQDAVLERERTLKYEDSVRQLLIGKRAANEEQLWAGIIAGFEKNAGSSKNQEVAAMNGRLLNYVGFIVYMKALRALKQDDVASAAMYLKLFRQAHPANPDYYYLTAVSCMKRNDAKAALGALNEAVAAGYNEAAQLLTEPAFAPLLTDPAFRKTVAAAGANNLVK